MSIVIRPTGRRIYTGVWCSVFISSLEELLESLMEFLEDSMEVSWCTDWCPLTSGIYGASFAGAGCGKASLWCLSWILIRSSGWSCLKRGLCTTSLPLVSLVNTRLNPCRLSYRMNDSHLLVLKKGPPRIYLSNRVRSWISIPTPLGP
jgi:hypothetical protein